MTAPVFVDTNVLVYFHDASEPDKRQRAAEWLSVLWDERAGRLSYQVLHEFYATVTRKLEPGLPEATARDSVRALQAWEPVSMSVSILEGAWSLQDRYDLSWWDSLIVSAARASGCSTLLTEDLQHGQDLGGVLVLSPFRARPDDR